MTKATSCKPTHKGWFGICPVYIAGLDSHELHVWERHMIFMPLFWFSAAMQGVCIFIISMLKADYEPAFAVRITGRVDNVF
jgi:hypothetical protein